MARRRFFVDQVRDGRAELCGEEARHVIRVLRAKPGQRYEISDNRALYLAEICEAAQDRVTFQVREALHFREPPARVTLLAALIKFDRFEWMVEKATELGVDRIVPVQAARSEKGFLEAARKRVERWRKIARESSQQSRRVRLPEIQQPQRLGACLDEPFGYRYFLEENPGATPILAALPDRAQRRCADTVALLAGPEGGWTEKERSGIAAAGWTAVSVGPYVLRTETAVLAAVSILMHAWQAADNL